MGLGRRVLSSLFARQANVSTLPVACVLPLPPRFFFFWGGRYLFIDVSQRTCCFSVACSRASTRFFFLVSTNWEPWTGNFFPMKTLLNNFSDCSSYQALNAIVINWLTWKKLLKTCFTVIVMEREGTFSVNKKFFVHYSAAFCMFRFLYFNEAFRLPISY